MRRTRLTSSLLTAALAGSTLALAPASSPLDPPSEIIIGHCVPGQDVTDGSVTSEDGTVITFTLFKPTCATAAKQAPVILHSHGWGGQRSKSGFTSWTDAGFGVLSFDQRGFGSSGGQANVQDPDFEAKDVQALIDHIATLDWVAKDVDANGDVIADDPVLGAIGGSYGGGYQWMTALTEIAETGSTRFNALAPEISWYDLPESLAPQGVVRTAWVSALYAAGARALPQYVHEGMAYGVATGQWPDGTVPGVVNLDAEFHTHGPAGYVERETPVLLDIPVMIRQGSSDNLFNLNEGIHNFLDTLTPEAREDSYFVAYNGGHTLPNVMPLGSASGADACSGEGSFEARTRDFFRAVLIEDGDTSGILPAQYNLTTVGGQCLRTDSIETFTEFATGIDATVTSGAITTTGVGAAQYLPITSTPMHVAGIPTMTADVTSVGVDQRAFFALAKGTSPATATVIQNNVMPLRELTPVVQQERTIELPGVAFELKAGETLYLVVSPISDMFAAHGSARTPGIIGLEDITVDLPIVTPKS